MSGRVDGENALVHNPGAKPVETGSRWTSAPGDGGCRLVGDIGELAAIR
jgi:hypothetical protein